MLHDKRVSRHITALFRVEEARFIREKQRIYRPVLDGVHWRDAFLFIFFVSAYFIEVLILHGKAAWRVEETVKRAGNEELDVEGSGM